MKWTIKTAILFAISAAALLLIWLLDGAPAAKFIALKILHLTAAAGVLYVIARVLSPVTSPEKWLALMSPVTESDQRTGKRTYPSDGDKRIYAALAIGAMIARAVLIGLALLGVAVGFPIVE